MKKSFLAALLALPLAALSAHAEGCCGPYRVNAGVNFNFRISGPGDYYGGQLGPWYLYWPMEAHFQTPAPTGYPYWPSPLTLPPEAGVGAPAPGNFAPASYQPGGYGAAQPSYWSR